MVLTVIQQGACRGLLCGIFRCSNKRLDDDAGAEPELAATVEVHFFCTADATARRRADISGHFIAGVLHNYFIGGFCISSMVISVAD